LLTALLEGQKPTSLVFDRIATTVDLSVLNLVMLPEGNGSIEKYLEEIKFILTTGSTKIEDVESSIESKYLILTLLLGIKYKYSLLLLFIISIYYYRKY